METRLVQGQRVTIIGLIVNIILAIGKGFFGVIGSSQALIADAIESVSDVIATSFVYISIKFSGKPKDSEHPYGHYKAEQLAAGLVGLVISLAGLVIVITAVLTIISGAKKTPTMATLYTSIIVIIIKEGLYRYTYTIGKRINSMAVIANAWDHRKDVLSTIATLTGIVGARIGYPFLDPIAAILVATFIFRIGFVISWQAGNELLDISPPADIIKKIKNIALSVEGIEHVNDIRARKTGPYIIVDIKLQIDSRMSVLESHSTSSIAKKEIMKQVQDVSDVMIHVDPHIRHD